jgi:integrase/recombinase XerD
MTGFEQFIQEKTYLQNVTPATIHWYRHAFKKLKNPNPTEQDLKEFVVRMRQNGLSAESVNCFGRAVNVYMHWLSGAKTKCHLGCQHPKVPKLQTDEKIPDTFDIEDIGKFARWKPKNETRFRLQVLVLLLGDTGLRIDEALSLSWPDINLDSMLMRVMGKGRKERMVAFSHALRRYLFKFKQKAKYDLVFCTRDGQKLSHRNVMRDVDDLCKRLCIRRRKRLLHAFRHSFASTYIRQGGDVFRLQTQLGHSDISMTRRYVRLNPSDLQAVHSRLSMLS